jgi:hypothetical protein
MKPHSLRFQSWVEAAALFILGALFYLLLAPRFGYYGSDCSAMYAARAAGPQIFRELYAAQGQPAGGLVMSALYSIFGANPLFYALSAYFLRVLGSLALLWLLRIVWPARRRETFAAAVLFLAYPGFLSQPNAIAIQAQLLALCMGFISLRLSLRSVSEARRLQRIAMLMGAILTGWFYLSLDGRYAGFEVFRIALLANHLRRTGQPLRSALKAWLPFSVIPLAYFAWLLFVPFAPMGFARTGPSAFLAQGVSLVEGVASSIALAWLVPFTGAGFALRLRDSLIAAALCVAVLSVFYLGMRFSRDAESEESHSVSSFAGEAFWLGLLWVVCAWLPGVFFGTAGAGDGAGYFLPAAAGGVMVLVSLLASVPRSIPQYIAISLLLISAATAHYANGVKFAAQAQELASFWWQVSWRVPQFEPGTTLVVHYPSLEVTDSSWVWGPASLVYDIPIAAIIPVHDAVLSIVSRAALQATPHQVLAMQPDPANVTVLSRPTGLSCVQLIDGTRPEFSTQENVTFRLVGAYSNAGSVRSQPGSAQPPLFPFGPEPARGWCYYYERASLARQQGDWDEVLRLAQEVSAGNLRADDMSEWLPFLQAYALNGDNEQLVRLSRAIWSDIYAARQACDSLLALPALAEDTRQVVNEKYCTRP